MTDQLIEKISDTQLPEPLASTLKEFIIGFEALPPQPNTINPHWMSFLINRLVDDICSEEEMKELWWETIIELAKKWAADRGENGQPVLNTIDHLSPILSQHFPDDDSEVTLQEVRGDTLFGITVLSETLTEPKSLYVAPNAFSIAQAYFSDKAWFRAIYAGRSPVGFVMLEIDEEKPKYYVWRLMIGEPFHGRGYGRKAMHAIQDHVRTLPNAEELYLSYAQGPGSPEGFYKKLGFEPTGETHGGEIEAKIAL